MLDSDGGAKIKSEGRVDRSLARAQSYILLYISVTLWLVLRKRKENYKKGQKGQKEKTA